MFLGYAVEISDKCVRNRPLSRFIQSFFRSKARVVGSTASPEQDQVLKLLNAKPELMALLLAMA